MLKSIVALSLFIMASLSVSWAYMNYRLLFKKPVIAKETVFEVNQGDGLQVIIHHLQAQKVAINPLWFRLYAQQKHYDQQVKPGEYVLAAASTSVDILMQFVQGKTRRYAITFAEGLSYKQILQLIQTNPNLQHTLATDAEPKKLLGRMGSDKDHPEGLFFPDTYFFEKNSTDVELLKRAHDKMQSVLMEEWQHRDTTIPIQTPYQALILASIVEKETAAVEERSKIAGVFSRRLQKGMLLQTDPTVIYGMGDDYHGDIHSKDLKQPTLYNTYVNAGLPPTPIAMPGRQAIAAALHPEGGDSLYFVATGDGHHVFSSTLTEHNEHVNHYQR